MGGSDKIIRLLAAAVLVILYANGTITGSLGWIVLSLAGIFLVTSLISFCPLYTLFGINTCKKSKT